MFAEYGVLNYWAYPVGVILIVLVPGPNILPVLKNSVSSGMKGGYLMACGIFIDDAVLMFLAWAGMVTLTKIAPMLFDIVRYLGILYLLYLGSRVLYVTLKGKNSETKSDEPQYGVTFKRALILGLANSKTILFHVSFFVQSIDVNAPHAGISFFILTTTLELVGFYYLGFLIISGASVMQYIRTRKRLAKVGNSLIGSIFAGFVAWLATLQSWCFQPALPRAFHP